MVHIVKQIGSEVSTAEVDESDFPYYDLFEEIRQKMEEKGCTMMSVGMPGINIVFDRKEKKPLPSTSGKVSYG